MNLFEHGGNLIELSKRVGCNPKEILDFSANINPLGFPEWLRPFLHSKIEDLISYPDPNYTSLKNKIHSKYQICSDQIVIGNGASELILQIPSVVQADYALIAVPCYSGYKEAVSLQKIPCIEIILKEEKQFRLDIDEVRDVLKSKINQKVLIFLGHPNNPTGITLDKIEILKLTQEFQNSIFVIDESFIHFCPKGSSFLKDRTKNMILIQSMTKILALPGLRIGICYASSSICSNISKKLPTWNVNSLAASVYEKAIDDEDYIKNSKQNIQVWKEKLIYNLSNLEFLNPFPSDTNFMLIKILDNRNISNLVQELLLKYKIAVRNCENFSGLSKNFIRIAVRIPEENEKIIDALSNIFYGTRQKLKFSKKTPSIMFQGTASNVGKSILTAALCRILAQDGIKVAPFKSQNMALNSFVTLNGEEIGRAQALQAQAAKILPDVRMNPILLKPSNERSSQVIINGKVINSMNFKNYDQYKPIAFEEVKKSYDSLSSEYNVIIIEGAGSASEVNLKKNDIVNMRMAEYAKADVLLVGNIDHGGLFGSILGTMETLTEWERKLVFGFVINRFRGIKELLKTGINYIEEYTNRPVIGIVPYIKNLELPEEDSLEFKSSRALYDTSMLGDRLDVVLIDIPRISNHTDIDALKAEPDVRVRIIRTAEDLGEPDVLILPGSKSVISDLNHLYNVGLADKIFALSRNQKTDIVGICGGYQMLGKNIFDPYCIESNQGHIQGISLLQIETILEKSKSLKRVFATHIPTKAEVEGYEIHHGKTKSVGDTRVILLNGKSEELGYSDSTGRIWGTYIHGIFDKDQFRRKYLDQIRIRKGKTPLVDVQVSYNLEKSLDRLAKHVRRSLNINLIYRKLGLS